MTSLVPRPFILKVICAGVDEELPIELSSQQIGMHSFYYTLEIVHIHSQIYLNSRLLLEPL